MLKYIIRRITSGAYMKKIAIEINEKTLFFKYRTNKPVQANLLNTNVISNNELVFSDDYIANNERIVSLFVADLFEENGIVDVIISNNDIAELVIGLFKFVKHINKITLKEDVNMSYALCDKLTTLSNVDLINCYTIPNYLLEMLDKNNIKIESRSEILFTSKFMEDNNLTSFSKIYYKSSIRIKDKIDDFDYEDLKSFLKVNKYLRTIHFEKALPKDIEKVIQLLLKERRNKISIQIHDDVNDLDVVDKLREFNKKYQKKKIKLALVYSKRYLEENYLKQIIFTTLKVCSLIIFMIVGSVFSYILYNNYQSEKKVEEIREEIDEIMKDADDSEPEPVPEPVVPQGNGEAPVQVPEERMIESYEKLLSINSDTVGWLTVPGTKIDYPIVQTSDNSYYLQRNFKRQKDYNGWVFMDYRNDPKTLDTNTIIYAHNRYYSGVMFGTLGNVTKKNWYNNPDLHYITFNTMHKKMTWLVFSVYSINVTSDYLYTNFNTNEEYQKFLTMITNRSMYYFGVPVSVGNKILTLSTFLDNNKRLVVHAVLMNPDPEPEPAPAQPTQPVQQPTQQQQTQPTTPTPKEEEKPKETEVEEPKKEEETGEPPKDEDTNTTQEPVETPTQEDEKEEGLE
jgi:sortase B